MSILLERISKRLGGQRILEDVSLEIADGELFVLLGASGSGKSTLLRLVAGLALPDEGRIYVHGRDVTHLPPQVRGTGFVFQNYSLFRHMSVAENVEFGLRIRGVSPAKRAEKRDELLDLVDLAGLGDRLPEQLSGGQRQRVALARALAYGPSVLLLDEPFGALDAKIRSQLRRGLRDVQDRLGVTTILVTHDQEEAFALGDRIGVIERGQLLEVDTPENLYARPRSLFVATFLGSGTVLVGTADKGTARFGEVALPIPADLPHEDGAPVQLLIRPEQVALDINRPEDGRPILGLGTVIETSFLGGQRRLRLRVPRIPRCRQLVPRAAFGETGLLVDAVVPADMPVQAGEQWVSLRGWHILKRPTPNVLFCAFEDRSELPHRLVGEIAEALSATVTVLGVAQDAGETDRVKRWVEDHVPGIDTIRRFRTGDRTEELLAEQLASLYELTVLPGPGAEGGGDGVGGGIDQTVRDVMRRGRGPLLITHRDGAEIRRVLICTAAGEPGKGDVYFGGRIARRLGAEITLLYVHLGQGEPGERIRAHLHRAAATLAAQDLPCEVRIREAGMAAAGILAEVETGRYDLLVMGGPGPQARFVWAKDDVTAQVVAATELPLLVVPADILG